MALSRFVSGLRPWQAAAALLIAASVFLAQSRPAEAAIGVTVNLTATTAGAASDLSIDVVFDTVPINQPATIVVTFPVGWTVPTSADLTAVGVSWAGLQDVAPTITSNAGTRTISTTIAVDQMLNGPIPAITLTIPNTAGLTNPGAGAHTITVDAPGSAQGVSAPFNITAAATAVTGVTISAAPLTAAAASTVTVAFTPSAAGALAAGNTITVVMTGYTFAAAPIVITPTGGFAGGLTGVGNGGNTVTVTLSGGASLAALTPGTFTFPATNPGAGAIAAAALTVATSQDTTAVQSSAGITIVGGATAVTGVTISAAPLTAAAASTVTVAFTPSAAGALAAGNTITVVMTGYTFAAAPIVITPTGGFAGGLTGVGNGGNTVTVTLSGGASLAALTPGTFTFPATNPGAGAIAAAALTVATSQDTTAVQSSAGITITAPPTPPQEQNDPDPGPGGGGGPPIFFPVTCNAGSYSANGECVPAPAGHFVALSGATSPTACLPGQYQPNEGMMFCFQVPAGSFTSVSGAAAATPWTVCPTGQVALTEGTATSDRVCGTASGPRLTTLDAAAEEWVISGELRRVTLVEGQTAYTVSVPAGSRHFVGGTADRGTITYTRGGAAISTTTLSTVGDVITITVTDGALSTTYTVTLSSSEVVCLNGGAASNGVCVCPAGFSGNQCQFAQQLTNAAITLSSSAPSATGVIVTITLRTPVAVPAGGKIKVSTNGVTFTSPVATFTSPSALANTAGFASGTLTVALPGGMSADNTVTFTVTGGTNPGAQAAVTTGAMSVTNSADAVLASTSTGTMPAIVAGTAVTAVTISAAPLVAGAPTTITAVARYTTALNAADQITVKLTGYTFEAGARTVTAGTGITGTLTGSVAAGALDTVVLTGGSVAAGSSATFTFPATNPQQAGAIAATGLTLRTSKDTTPVASSAGFTIAGAPEITGGAITLSSTAASATGVVATMTLRTPVSIPAGGKITVTMPGFTWPATPAAQFISGHGTTTVASTSFASNVLTVTTGTAAINANSSLVLTVTGATNPSAPRAASTNVAMSVRNSADAVLASTSTGTMVAIVAPPLSVSIAGPTTAVAGPAGGLLRLNATVTTDLDGATPSYAWTTTGGVCDAAIASPIRNSSSFGVTVANNPITCTFTVTVTAGSRSATASHVIEFTAAAPLQKPRLEFLDQPTDSTNGKVEFTVRVIARKADGTPDPDSRMVLLQGERTGQTVIFATANTDKDGVATFTRSWTQSVADANWILRAVVTSGFEDATSRSFRVTKQKVLKFTTQPSGGIAGTAFSGQPVVKAYKADGTEDTAFRQSVTLTLKSDTANGATLRALAAAGTVEGAKFTGVSINNAGSGYVLVASATGYTEIASVAFNVTGPATKLVITQAPASAMTGAPLTTDVRVEARDANDRPVPGAASGVRLLHTDRSSFERTLRSAPSSVDGATAVFSGADILMGAKGTGISDFLVAQATGLTEGSASFILSGPPAKLVFVQQPGGWGASPLGTQPIVEIQDVRGNRVPGATDLVSLRLALAPESPSLPAGTTTPSLSGADVAAQAGRATFTQVRPGSLPATAAGARFTITASSGSLATATSAAFGPPRARVIATKLEYTSTVPSTLKVGEKFNLTVAAKDASGAIDTDALGTVVVRADQNGRVLGSAAFAPGTGTVTFLGLSFTSPGAPYTLSASSGALTTAQSSGIAVTAAATPAGILFERQLSYESSGTLLTIQPRVKLIDRTSAAFTAAPGTTVTLKLGRERLPATTAVLDGTLTATVAADGTATWTGLKVTGADRGLVLTATWSDGVSTLTATTSPFDVFATATEAATRQASSQTQSVTFKIKLDIDAAVLDNKGAIQTALKNDICSALRVGTEECARVVVKVSTESSRNVVAIEDGAGRLLATANVESVDGETTVLIGSVNLVAFQAENGAPAPAGTRALYAIGRVAFDDWGNQLDVLPSRRSFSLPVPEDVVLLGTRPGDLKIAMWDGERWAQVPSSAVVEPDGSFTVTATTDALGVFAVLYAPGAARIQGVNGFSDSGAAFAVFDGGSAAVLSNAAGLNDANGVWVQDARGQYRLLVVGGPAFLADEFASHFTDGVPVSTAVTLMQTRTAPASNGGAAAGGTSATSYTVTGTDTLSGIGARFGVDWMRIAAANGIAGPNYLVRAGQTLTIPAR